MDTRDIWIVEDRWEGLAAAGGIGVGDILDATDNQGRGGEAVGMCRATKLGDAAEQRELQGKAPTVWLARRIKNFMLSVRREPLPVDMNSLIDRVLKQNKRAA